MVPQASRTLVIGLNKIGLLAISGFRIFLLLTLVLTTVTPGNVASAQDGGPEDPATGAAGKMLEIFISLVLSHRAM